MSEIEILEKNPNKIINLLSIILSSQELQKIADLRNKHCKMLLKLSYHHLKFAKEISSSKDWRQKISRAYYSCYNASKALRLNTNGEYSQQGADHKNIGKLPNSFPNENTWSNFLNQFRSDRNLADYDHEKKCSELAHAPKKYINKSEEFYIEAKKYLKGRGIV